MKVIHKVIKNNFYALKWVWQVCRQKVIWHMSVKFMQAIFDFITGIYFLKIILWIIQAGKPYNIFCTFVIIILILNTIRALVNAFYYFEWEDILNNRVTCGLNKAIFQKVIHMDAKNYENTTFYDNYYWAIQNAERNIVQIVNIVSNIISSLFLCIVIAVYVVKLDPIIFLFLVFPLAGSIFVKKGYQVNTRQQMETTGARRQKDYVKEVVFQKKYANEMRMTNMYSVLEEKLEKSITNILMIYQKYKGKRTVLYILAQLLMGHIPFIAACYYAIYKFAVLKNLDAGDFAVLVTAITMFNLRISKLINDMGINQQCSAFAEKLRVFFEYEPTIKSGDKQADALKELVVNNVTFTYENEKKAAVSDVCFKVRKGETVAIVGNNGAGKTTLIKLLLRLYDPDQGEITYNGINIKELDVKGYRGKFGTVFQSNHIFALNLAENVLLDHYEPDKSPVVRRSLIKTGMEKFAEGEHNFLKNLTKEFDGEGMELSGGQEQKVFLSRLYAKDFEIAVLDEPSSSLDPVSEYSMYEKLLDATKEKAVIFISHTLSAAVFADKIIVMADGKIIETGTHKELIKAGQVYASMFFAQAEKYLAGESNEKNKYYFQ